MGVAAAAAVVAPLDVVVQDNEAFFKVFQNKYPAKLRHCNRIRRVNVALISALLERDGNVSPQSCNTERQLANALMRIPPIHWQNVLDQLCIVAP